MVQFYDIVKRLTMLGYSPKDTDKDLIEFNLTETLNYVVNQCNFPDYSAIPRIIEPRIIDRVCSDILMQKKNSGQLEGFDYEGTIKTIKEGDTQIQFGTSNDGETPESRFDNLVDSLNRTFDKWISLHRRIKW